MKENLFFITMFFVTLNCFAQNSSIKQKIETRLKERGEVVLKTSIKEVPDITEFSKFACFDEIKGDEIYFYVNRKQYESLLSSKIKFEPALKNFKKLELQLKNSKGSKTYPSYGEYIKKMQAYPKKYPNLCSLDTIGKSTKGKLLLSLKISDNASKKEAEPEFFYTSTMHGDELVGFALMLDLIDYLLENYEKNDQVTRLVNNIEIYINPNANPDGTYYGGDNNVMYSTRANANSIDLNRNFPDARIGENPDEEEYQAETLAMIEYMKKHNFVMSANFHSGAEVFNYPWDTWYDRHPDDEWEVQVAKQYADTVFANATKYYFKTVENNGYTHGADWYRISGSRQDFANFFCHTREVTIELHDTKLTAPQDISKIWEYNYRSMLNHIEQVLWGINGRIIDATTNKSVLAKIEILEHDERNSHILSDSITGMYYRPIAEGTYNLKISAEGYPDTIINNVAVTQGNETKLNVELKNSLAYITDKNIFNTQNNEPTIKNPFTNTLSMWWEQKEISEISISIIDALGRKNILVKNKKTPQGKVKYEFNTANLSAGTYFLKIKQNNKTNTYTIIKSK